MNPSRPTNCCPAEQHERARGAAILDALARRARVTFIVATVLFFVGRFGHLHWIADLISHFVVHLAAVTFGCAIILLVARRPPWSAAAAVLLAAELSVLAPYLIGGELKAGALSDGPTLRVLQFNVNGDNSNWQSFVDWVRPRAGSFDVIVLLENKPGWRAALEVLKEEFPDHVEETRTDSFGIAVFTRLPDSKLNLRHLGPSGIPAVEMRARLGAHSVTLIAAHAYAPLGKSMSEQRNHQLQELARWITASPSRYKILLGDFNVTPFSSWYRDLLNVANLVDAQNGLGLLATWAPSLIPRPLGLQIDHTLVSSNVSIVSRNCGARLGSDHCPITTELVTNP